MVMNDELKESFDTIINFQNSEEWRRIGVWETDELHVDVNAYAKGDSKFSDVLSKVQGEMENKKYFVVQQSSDELENDGTIPISVSIMDGKSIKNAIALGGGINNGISESFAYGPAMASQSDVGYYSDVQYIMDVTNLSKRAQSSLVRSAESVIENAQDNLSYADFGDEDFSPVENTVRSVISDAYDNGAVSPYVSLFKELENSLQLETAKEEVKKEAVKEVKETAKVKKEPVQAVKKEKIKKEPVKKAVSKETKVEVKQDVKDEVKQQVVDTSVKKEKKGNAFYKLSPKQRGLVVAIQNKAKENDWRDEKGNLLHFDSNAENAQDEINRLFNEAKAMGFQMFSKKSLKPNTKSSNVNNGVADGM